MTKLELLLKDGKATKPYLRSVFHIDNSLNGGKIGWRLSFVQQRPSTASTPTQNSLLRKSLAINDWVTYTAIITTTEKFLEETFKEHWAGENLFFVSQNQDGSPVNKNIPGEFKIIDELISADALYQVEEGTSTVFVVESFTINPYRVKSMLPVSNPRTGDPVLITAPDGVSRPYYRHTEIRSKAELFGAAEMQSIGDYVKLATNGGEEKPFILLPSTLGDLMSKPATMDVARQLMANPYLVIDLSSNVPFTTAAEKVGIGNLLGARTVELDETVQLEDFPMEPGIGKFLKSNISSK